jgi:hypothetical protein
VTDQESSSPQRLLAFHWASFGSDKQGIGSPEQPPSDAYRVVTRFDGRGRIHVISLALSSKTIISTMIQVEQQETEFSLRSEHHRNQKVVSETFNNSLIDCHLEVWTRFPVVPAISRNTLLPISQMPRKLTFVSSTDLTEVESYFARMISTFETTTQKPTGGSLTAIVVSSTDKVGGDMQEDASEFRMGSFILELLCLLPLQ